MSKSEITSVGFDNPVDIKEDFDEELEEKETSKSLPVYDPDRILWEYNVGKEYIHEVTRYTSESDIIQRYHEGRYYTYISDSEIKKEKLI